MIAAPSMPQPPPMRVVEKGWWRWRETSQPRAEVERENEERRLRDAAKLENRR
jgi:hypothetical protein